MIHILYCWLHKPSNLFHYDDKTKSVFAEPLVESTTEAIHQILLSGHKWDDWQQRPALVNLRFTADPGACLNLQLKMDHPIVKLHYLRKDKDMSIYGVEGIFPQRFVDEWEFMDEMGEPTEVELCEHLMDYFPSAPELFYCQISLPVTQASSPLTPVDCSSPSRA